MLVSQNSKNTSIKRNIFARLCLKEIIILLRPKLYYIEDSSIQGNLVNFLMENSLCKQTEDNV
jgi:hypothetical protein